MTPLQKTFAPVIAFYQMPCQREHSACELPQALLRRRRLEEPVAAEGEAVGLQAGKPGGAGADRTKGTGLFEFRSPVPFLLLAVQGGQADVRIVEMHQPVLPEVLLIGVPTDPVQADAQVKSNRQDRQVVPQGQAARSTRTWAAATERLYQQARPRRALAP